MSLFYTLAYAVGFTPWERAAKADPDTLPRLIGEVEARRGGPGKALDLGCGSGPNVVALARRGWEVTGVDLVEKAIARAKQRVAESGVNARVELASVTTLDRATVGSGFDLFVDVGCFHGLTDDQRRAEGAAVTSIAAPDATVIMLAFMPNRVPRPLPRGADAADVKAAFPGWKLAADEAAVLDGLPRPVKRAEPHWYTLRRES